MPVTLPAVPSTGRHFEIRLSRGPAQATVQSPVSEAGACVVMRVAAVIRVDAIWLASEPLKMRACTETALARVVAVFGVARPHQAYCLANRRANRMKMPVHDGIGVWLAARRLNKASSCGPMPCVAPTPRSTRHSGGRWCWACPGSM
ncbi:IS66 Orf2 like protein [compost metagenome]